MRGYSNDFWTLWVYVYPLFFVALWCAVSYCIGLLSGWRALARRFSAQGEPYGEAKSAGPFFYGVRMQRKVNYSGAIRLTAGEEALYLSVLFLFRVGHPPLTIPWGEIKLKRARILWQRYVLLTLGRDEQVPMRISERMARKLGIVERAADVPRMQTN